MFPPELVEKILYYCDGCTLTRARGVCRLWKQSADYLIEKREQLTVCCERELGAATLSQLWAEGGSRAASYRAWYRHSRLAHWPVTQAPPLDMALTDALTVTCIDGDCVVVAASASGVGLFDLFGDLLYQLPCWHASFPVCQLEVSHPIAGRPDQQRLLVVAHTNGLVRVAGFRDDQPHSMSPPVPLPTHEGDNLTVSVCEDLVCVSYRREAWLYRIRPAMGTVHATTVCVVDLSSSDGMTALASCCHRRMACVSLRAGGLVWCDAREARPARGTLSYPVLRLTPRRTDWQPQTEPAADLHPADLRALHFNTVNVAASLGTEVVLGHVQLGCRTVDVFSALRCRVSTVLLHGRLLLLGTDTGCLAVYFVVSERALPELELSRPAGRLQLGCAAPLQRLFAVDQADTVRVLARDAAGRLHHCYWRRPGADCRPTATGRP